MPRPIRLLLVDTETLLRRSLVALLNRRRGLQVVGEATCGKQAIGLARSLQPDVVILDPVVPDGGTTMIESLCQTAPSAAVLVLTLGGEDGAATRALQAGARGYLEKTCEPDDLVRGIERLHAGDLVVALTAPTLLDGQTSDASRAAGATDLTERELEVLRLVVDGLTNPSIARELHITEHTVKGHLAKILGKLGVENRVQLATYAMQHGIAEPTLLETPA